MFVAGYPVRALVHTDGNMANPPSGVEYRFTRDEAVDVVREAKRLQASAEGSRLTAVEMRCAAQPQWLGGVHGDEENLPTARSYKGTMNIEAGLRVTGTEIWLTGMDMDAFKRFDDVYLLTPEELIETFDITPEEVSPSVHVVAATHWTIEGTRLSVFSNKDAAWNEALKAVNILRRGMGEEGEPSLPEVHDPATYAEALEEAKAERIRAGFDADAGKVAVTRQFVSSGDELDETAAACVRSGVPAPSSKARRPR